MENIKDIIHIFVLPLITITFKRLLNLQRTQTKTDDIEYFSEEIKEYYKNMIQVLGVDINFSKFKQLKLEKDSKICEYIDHTLLKSNATKDEITNLCQEAIKFNFKAICVNFSRLDLCQTILKGTTVKTAVVIGF
jgi:hypothetical protein